TLDQGFKEKLVSVTEKEQEQVRELQIENSSAYPLFLQEGDRLQGGKQDRIITSSLVVAAHSGKLTVPAFCIEQSRWHAGRTGQVFDATCNAAPAPKSGRCAAKVQMNQSQVWDKVREQKALAVAKNLASNTNSSLNETLDAPEVKKISDECAN